MQKKNVQMSLSDIYSDVVIQLLDDHIDFDSLIPVRIALCSSNKVASAEIWICR